MRGIALIVIPLLLNIPLLMAVGFVLFLLRPRLVLNSPEPGDVNFRITGPREPPSG
jgi:hypothetical protein